MSINICICGGGGLGHVIAGVAAHKGFNVSVLTRHPEQWNPSLLIENCRGNTFSGSLACVTANPAEVIPHSDIVLLYRKHIKIRYFTTNSSRNVRYAGAYASSFSRSQPDQ